MSVGEANEATRAVSGGIATARWVEVIERTLRWGTEIPGAILLVAEIAIIASGVVARYVFHSPLFWVDEAAAVMFVWISMLGAVVALQRGEHMRLTLVLDSCSRRWRDRLNAVNAVLIAGAALLLVPSAFEHLENESFIQMVTLGISEGFRASAFLVGFVMLAAIAVLRLGHCRWRDISFALAVVAVAGLCLYLARPWMMSIGNLNLLIFFVLLLGALIAIGLPIAFTFIICTSSYLVLIPKIPLVIVVTRMGEGMSSMVLLAIPLFIVLGLLIEVMGLARALVNFMAALLGHVRGGLSYVLLGAMFLVSGIAGSKAADMAAVAPGLIPEMKRRGAHQGELAAQLSASAVMTETIPPSLVLIMLGSSTGISIGALFAGGLLPAVVCTLALVITVYFRMRSQSESVSVARASGAEIRRTFVVALPALALPFIIRSAVVEGVATATEVSTLGVIYALVVGALVYRNFSVSQLVGILRSTVALTGAVLLILGVAISMAWALTQSGFAKQLVVAMSSIPGGAWGFIIASILGFIVLGSVLEGLPAILVFGPLLFPAARAMGIHDVHYAMIIIIAMGIGLFAPPLGIGYYAACGIARVPPNEAMVRIWPYLGALALALLLIAAVPWFSIALL
ncbi:TRAP transporter large permease subunit [Xanthobacter autotrophicus DSM 431]|uniref:TRAP transporter large permease n=1 Tax=Xanthobacter nonsaccharivorans TaxID=3119912 RepID=UPI003726B5C8